jgi:hypothetical protein
MFRDLPWRQIAVWVICATSRLSATTTASNSTIECPFETTFDVIFDRFSAVFEGGLVIGATLAIFHSAYLGFLAPKPLDVPFVGLAINGGASAINGAWAWLLLLWGRRWRSPALVADGRHVLTDEVTSAGVIVGVAVVAVTRLSACVASTG